MNELDPLNQCDGCKLGWPVDKNLNHVPPPGESFTAALGCTKHRYLSGLPFVILNQKVAEAQAEWKKYVGEDLHRDRITCTNCLQNANCEYAFDGYNTDGDCLALK